VPSLLAPVGIPTNMFSPRADLCLGPAGLLTAQALQKVSNTSPAAQPPQLTLYSKVSIAPSSSKMHRLLLDRGIGTLGYTGHKYLSTNAYLMICIAW